QLLDAAGPAAPPRANGELAFNAPWERRIFGLTMALTRTVFNYEDFRQHLIARVGQAPERPYWQSWAAALEDALNDACVLDVAALDERHLQFLSRPHGHDH
ncbi:MAG TPA: hypothetical protein VK948_04380, partial [Aeromicrobium sp.]|nr:hypothetical protein [Aeromicrobium sp.]